MAEPHPLLLPLLTDGDIPTNTVISLDVVESAEEHWVAALVDAAVINRDIPVTPEAQKRLTARSLATQAEVGASVAAASTLVKTADSLGIGIGVFKGLAVGTRFYTNAFARPSVDVDIFIDPGSSDRMGELAVALGTDPEDRSAIDAMVAEGRRFEVSVEVEDFLVDLHRDPMSMVALSRYESDVWRRTVPLLLPDGTETRTLDLEDTVLHSLLHLFRDNFADLLHINDVGLLIAADPDWDVVAQRAELEGRTDIVRFALWFVSQVLGQPSPLPTRITRWRKLFIDRVWPRDILLQGHMSHEQSFRRQFAVGLLVDDGVYATGRAYAQRLVPQRVLIDYRSDGSNGTFQTLL
jgi:hypothetical protein